MPKLLIPTLAVISGFAITLQGQFMGLLDRALGSKGSVFITYVSGGIIVALGSLLSGGLRLRSETPVPWFAYTSGVLGLIIVGTIGYVVPRIGAARGFTLIVSSQFLLAALIDQFGLFGAVQRPFDLSRSIGLLVILAGVWLVVR